MTSNLLLAIATCAAQATPPVHYSPDDPKGLTDASLIYHGYRLDETVPPFDLPKIEKLCAAIHRNRNEDYGVAAIPGKRFRALSTPAKFTYCMIYGENFSQNCDGMPAVLSEEIKIFAQPVDAFSNEADWSDRQRSFLHSHRLEVIALLRQTIKLRGRIGANLKKAILEIDAREMIPDLVSFFEKSSKDKDILSTLSVLMKRVKYAPYVKTPLFKKLYGEDSSYQASAPDTAQNEKLILDSAIAFGKQRKA